MVETADGEAIVQEQLEYFHLLAYGDRAAKWKGVLPSPSGPTRLARHVPKGGESVSDGVDISKAV